MKSIIQRVSKATVTIEGQTRGEISKGLLVLVGFGPHDDHSFLFPFARKVAEMRLFPDERGRFDQSVLDIGGGVLAVSQFTLFADCRKGRRPEFFGALDPERARTLYSQLIETFKEVGVQNVQQGEFGAHMKIDSINDGPVTIPLDFPIK